MMTPKPLTRVSALRWWWQHLPPVPLLQQMPWWVRGLLIAAGYVVLAWLEVLLWTE